MIRARTLSVLLFILLFSLLAADYPVRAEQQNKTSGIDKELLKKAQESKVVKAYRLTGPINLDGQLTEEIYHNPAAEDFLQTDPVDGQAASEKTRVWVAYDQTNIYVGAYCYDSNPKGIIGQLGRRDYSVDSDWFIFALIPILTAGAVMLSG